MRFEFHSPLSRRRPCRSLRTLEALEARQMLAVDALGGLSLAEWLGAPTQEYAEGLSPWTNSLELAVATEAGFGDESFDTLEGLARRNEFSFLPNVEFLAFTDSLAMTSALTVLATMDGVTEVVPLQARELTPRFVPNDPMFTNQWHLRNTGQGGGTVGADIDAVNAWDQATGQGVVIGIVDDGLTHTHADLSGNYLASASWDFNFNDANPTGGSHGTSVAGVAAAVTNNSVGVSGAAPDAELAGLRLIAGGVTDATEALALNYQHNVIDIYSNSWGPFDDGQRLEGPGPLTQAAFVDAVTNGRNGLGNIYVWAGGNGANNDNVNYDGYANSRYTIAVGAITNRDLKSSYSEVGAPLLVTAYSNGGTLGITTTAPGGYTSGFGGTSSAAPLASGVIALMLEANPNLTWRDVKHVLVHSAQKISPADPEWVTNGAGHLVNNKFGFGAVDATTAIDVAQSWVNVGPEVNYKSGVLNVGAAIPDNNPTGISRTFTVPEDITLETVEVVFNATHGSRGHLVVTLTSPSGTVSRLTERHTDNGNNFNNWTLTTVRNWDESSEGVWTLTVSDQTAATTGTWNSWQLNVYGTQANAPPSLDLIGPQSVDEGNLLAFQAKASDADPGDLLTFSLGPGAPAGASIDPMSGDFTWTPADSSLAPVVVRVIVSDGSNQDFEDVSISVGNLAPTANAGGPYTVIETHALSLVGGGTDPAGLNDPLTFSWDLNGDDVFGDAEGAAPTLTWSELAGLGLSPGNTYTVKVQANDGEGGVTTSAATSLTIEALPAQLVGVALGGAAAHAVYSVPTGSGEQLRTIPVGAIDRISLTFSEDVAFSGNIVVSGVNVADYPIGSFTYDAIGYVATWFLASPITEADQIKIALSDSLVTAGGAAFDGSWDNPTSLNDPTSSAFPSGDDLPGGSLEFYVTILPGDANRDNRVDGADFTVWGDHFGASGASFEDGDFNGDGLVDGADFTEFADHFGIDYTTAPSLIAPDTSPRPAVAPARTLVGQPTPAAPEAARTAEPTLYAARRSAVDRVLARESFGLIDRLGEL